VCGNECSEDKQSDKHMKKKKNASDCKKTELDIENVVKFSFLCFFEAREQSRLFNYGVVALFLLHFSPPLPSLLFSPDGYHSLKGMQFQTIRE
jgi:hypothetical protein